VSILKSPYLVPFDQSFTIKNAAPQSVGEIDEKVCRKSLKATVKAISKLQKKFYADNRYGLLLVFQAMDAAGKDSTIRSVMSGINPAGCEVYSFKQPSSEELDHDFLWRTSKRIPEKGRIGVFNRSYYEEVLVVKVHPEYLGAQKLPSDPQSPKFWEHRYKAIRDHEQYLHENGIIVVKFWLNVSKEEQKQRFLSRLQEPEKHWKFSVGDVQERKHWSDYMRAYEQALNETSRSWAPWYAIPADNKPLMRLNVAEIILEHMQALDLSYPHLDESQRKEFSRMKKILAND